MGKDQEKDVSSYEFRLSQKELPAQELSHAVTIAYFQERKNLSFRFPDGYICCDSENNEVQVWIGEDHKIPSSENVKVNGASGEYEVRVRFLQGTVSKLCSRPH